MPQHVGGPVVTVFRSRLRPDAGGDYHTLAAEMLEHARSMPGFVDFASFTAEDGERVSLITFATLEAQHTWRDDARHRAAQQAGRDRFYAEYEIQVCELLDGRAWRRGVRPGS